MKMTKSSFSRLRNKYRAIHGNDSFNHYCARKINKGLWPVGCFSWKKQLENTEKNAQQKRINPNPDMPRYSISRTPADRHLAHMRALALRRKNYRKRTFLKKT